MKNFDLSWFTTVPGMFITGGVVLLIIALIILLVTGKKSKKEKKLQESQATPTNDAAVAQATENVATSPFTASTCYANAYRSSSSNARGTCY